MPKKKINPNEPVITKIRQNHLGQKTIFVPKDAPLNANEFVKIIPVEFKDREIKKDEGAATDEKSD